MRRVLSFTDQAAVVIAAAGIETEDGYVTLPLKGSYLIEKASFVIQIDGKILNQPMTIYYEGANYRQHPAGYSAFVNLYAHDGNFDFYEQNEVSGTNFDSFTADKKIRCPVNQVVDLDVLFTGKEIGFETKFMYPYTLPGGMTQSEALWTVNYHYNLIIENDPRIIEGVMNGKRYISRGDVFGFDPSNSNFANPGR